ncbi:MAG: hypothetical protein ACYS0H_30575, partial [Planctomycetota bacterium]
QSENDICGPGVCNMDVMPYETKKGAAGLDGGPLAMTRDDICGKPAQPGIILGRTRYSIGSTVVAVSIST